MLSLTMPVTMTKSITDMPYTGSKHALHFNPKHPRELLEFISDFEDAARACNVTDEEKVKCIIKYTNSKTKSFWKSLGGFKEKDWGALKESILNTYPGAKKGEAHTHNEQKMLMKRFSTKYISFETDLVKYYQLFHSVAQALVKHKSVMEQPLVLSLLILSTLQFDCVMEQPLSPLLLGQLLNYLLKA